MFKFFAVLIPLSIAVFLTTPAPASPQNSTGSEAAMSKNQQTVQQYMEAFNRTDHAAILSCLTEDVEWVLPGVFHLKGKEAFDKEIENPAFVGSPIIKVTRIIEEG